MITKEQLANLIDYTLLKPDATKASIEQLCEEAKKYNFWSVCVNPIYVSLASNILRESNIKICSVIGFPLGANTPDEKTLETETAIRDGAHEIDMVINLGALKSHDYELVKREILKVVERARSFRRDIIVKVIIETALLTEDEKVLACKLVKDSGADFVKTSTGFNASGATVHDIKLLRKIVGPNIGVKASGGIKTIQKADELIKAGANRIGTSSGVEIIEQLTDKSLGRIVNSWKKEDNYAYFLCLINWQSLVSTENLKDFVEEFVKKGDSPKSIGDWITIQLGWEKKEEFNELISESTLGFYHSRFIFTFKLKKKLKLLAEIRELREKLEKKIKNFFQVTQIIDEIEKIKKIDETGVKDTPLIFTYPIFKLNREEEFWKSKRLQPYTLPTTCFYTKLDDENKNIVEMRISGAKIIAMDMSDWFFEILVNIVFHEGLYRQTRENIIRNSQGKVYGGLENRLENFASKLMTTFHQYSSDIYRRRMQKKTTYITIGFGIIGPFLTILGFVLGKVL